MGQRNRTHWGRVLRRGVALGLGLTVAWVISLTADLSGLSVPAALEPGEGTGLAVLRAELSPLELVQGPAAGLSGWQRLVLDQWSVLGGLEDAPADGTGGEEDPLPAAEEDEGEQEVQPQASAPAGEVTERTLVPSANQRYDSAQGVYIYNPTSQSVDVAALAAAPLELTLPEQSEGPQLLIFHTHGTEAYTPDGTDVYEPTDPYRTLDTNYNMVRVGEEMAAVLEEAGFSVYHDTTLYDYPSYNDAYDRSYEGVQALLEQYPTIQVVLDVHRDALEGTDGTVYKTMAQLEGERSAQVMLVMGSDDNGLSHEHWRENLALAVRLQLRLNEDWPTLARPISLRSGRYNQQLSLGSVLVEVGSHGNSLQEALQAARLFAQSAAQVLSGLVQAQ